MCPGISSACILQKVIIQINCILDITLNINIEELCCSRTSPKIHKFCDFNPFNFFFLPHSVNAVVATAALYCMFGIFTSWHCQIYFHFYLSFVRHKRLSERAEGGGGEKKVCRTEFSAIMNGEKNEFIAYNNV